MEITLNAKVECTDGEIWYPAGRCVSVLFNPLDEKVTHLVVKADKAPHIQYLVPVELAAETSAEEIRLSCSRDDLEKMDPFIKTTYIEKSVPASTIGGAGMYGMGGFYYAPYVMLDVIVKVPEEHQQIPAGELAIRRGTHVEATDGEVGKVDEFVVNPKTGHITHLVMREGHLWGQKEVVIPVSALGETRENTVHLKLDKHQIEILPTLPIHRRWG